ncbi:hypothetical protein K505DRAFT_193526, partial [Melanomma pulvis-pyrius CBS 109.77]
ETLPPNRHISSTPITLPAASTLLTRFLSNSESHPHLHPDALITPTGVTFSSHGGPLGGVVMHNLRRVAAGLRGEYLEPEATPEPEEEEDRQGRGKGKGIWAGKKTEGVGEGQQDGWQDREEYEREVEVEVGEVGERDTFVGEASEVQVAEGEKKRKNTEAEGEDMLDKEARRKAKKMRNKELKRQKEKERAE